MPFGMKNGPPTYKRVVNRTLKDYLNKFMEMFLDDYIIYNDMDTHLNRIKLWGVCTNGWTDLGVMQANFVLWLPLQCPC
jgi:hypothetical protein